MKAMTLALLAVLGVACARGREHPARSGNVVFGTINIEQGTVSTNALTDKLGKLHPVMEGCYTDALLDRPATEGAMDMKLRGEQAGVTVEVTKNTINDPSLTQCIVQAVKSADFKSDSGGTPSFVAGWSLDFKPKG